MFLLSSINHEFANGSDVAFDSVLLYFENFPILLIFEV